MGFLIVGTGGGGSFTPDGTLPTYTTMSALDAGLTVVGRLAQLVGATTGAVIATVLRVASGARGLIWLGEMALDQADGTELDGSFAPVSLGAAAAVTWGGVGARGMIIPTGTCKLPGWQYVTGARIGIVARMVGWVTPSVPAQHDALSAGFIRDTTGVIAYGGGIGYNSLPARRGALISAGTLDLPTGTYATTVESGLVDGAAIDCAVHSERNNATDGARYISGYTSAGVPSGGLAAGGVAFQADRTDWQPAFTRRGNWGASARVTRIMLARAIT